MVYLESKEKGLGKTAVIISMQNPNPDFMRKDSARNPNVSIGCTCMQWNIVKLSKREESGKLICNCFHSTISHSLEYQANEDLLYKKYLLRAARAPSIAIPGPRVMRLVYILRAVL